MANSLFSLVAIILLAGVFGGLLNYYMHAHIDSDNNSMPRSLVAGLFLSALVPFALWVVSRDFLEQTSESASGLLVFAGLCLLAAWSSRFLITSVTKTIQAESKHARERTDELLIELRLLQREIEPFLELETETDEGEEVITLAPEDELDVTTANVLTALGNGRYIFRSLKGLEQETDLDEHTLSKTLGIIVARDLGGKILSKKGTRWFITQKGRQFLAASS
jgi:hypothetical protein